MTLKFFLLKFEQISHNRPYLLQCKCLAQIRYHVIFVIAYFACARLFKKKKQPKHVPLHIYTQFVLLLYFLRENIYMLPNKTTCISLTLKTAFKCIVQHMKCQLQLKYKQLFQIISTLFILTRVMYLIFLNVATFITP